MIPGPDKIIACPHCGALARYGTLVSGNTFGSTRWTDGKMEAPMLPQPPAVTRCVRCEEYYWLDDAKPVGELPFGQTPPWGTPKEWLEAAPVQPLTIEQCAEALTRPAAADALAARDLRVFLWWALNDIVRLQVCETIPENYAELFSSNLEALLPLLSEESPEDRLMRAEALRELDRCEEVAPLLTGLSEDYAEAVRTIHDLAEQGDTIVRRLP